MKRILTLLALVCMSMAGCNRKDPYLEKLEQQKAQELKRNQEEAARRVELSKAEFAKKNYQSAMTQAIISDECLPSDESKKALRDAYDAAIEHDDVPALRYLLEREDTQKVVARLAIAPTPEQRSRLIRRAREGVWMDDSMAVLLITADAKEEMQVLYDKVLRKKDGISVGLLGPRVDAIGDWRKQALIELARAQLEYRAAESRGFLTREQIYQWKFFEPLYALVLEKAPDGLTDDETATMKHILKKR